MTPTTFALISVISEELHFSHDEYFMNINKGHKESKRSLRLELNISCYFHNSATTFQMQAIAHINVIL